MAFSNYKTLESVKEKYPHIYIQDDNFIPRDLVNISISAYLEDEIDFNLRTYKSNEFLAAENLVSPILRAAWRPYADYINYWSHQSIKYDDDLSGVPDFLFTNLEHKQYKIMSYPILTSVEAKAENFVEGWSQCIVQMLACQKLNSKPNVTIFGIVTTGKFWEFGKLESDTVSIHSNSYSIENLPKLMTILDYLLSEAKKQL
jgi:hypothetical protein